MPRAQISPRSAGIEQATRDVPGALTADAISMYRQALSLLRQFDALAVKTKQAEHSHNRAALTRELDHVRSLVGMLVDGIYRVACESPASKFSHVNHAQAELVTEAMRFLWPESST